MQSVVNVPLQSHTQMSVGVMNNHVVSVLSVVARASVRSVATSCVLSMTSLTYSKSVSTSASGVRRR